MLHQNIASELLVTLSNQQQEVVAGGADFELSGSNYANRLANLQGITSSGPGGSAGNSIGTTSAVNTAAQDLLGLGATAVPTIGALGAAPILTGLPDGAATSGQAFGNPGVGSPLGGLGLGSNQ
jgi:hypothetical protein